MTTNKVLDFTNLDSPACNCFPDCEATEYIPNVSNEDRTLTEDQNKNHVHLNDSQITEFRKD